MVETHLLKNTLPLNYECIQCYAKLTLNFFLLLGIIDEVVKTTGRVELSRNILSQIISWRSNALKLDWYDQEKVGEIGFALL